MDRGSEIVKLIEKNPGIKFRETMRETGMKNGVLSYHVKKLEENGTVKIERKSGRTRFYPLFVTKEESILIRNLRQETPRRILLALLNDQLFLSPILLKKCVNHHLQFLRIFPN